MPQAEPIDLRSDTVTLPCEAMRHAMVNAPLGDDVIDVDPTVRALEELTAELTGKEAAIYLPSGSMSNQIALRLHCDPGDEFICEEGCHIFNYEQGAYAQLSGLASKTVKGINSVMTVPQVAHLVRGINEHCVRTRLLCLENTHNRGGGCVLPYDNIRAMCQWADENGLRKHLDGARLFNAVVATGIDARNWSTPFDTVSVCFSKGLGAPVGSALAGPKDLIAKARYHRKLFGGGMRQAGIIAAGAHYALSNNIERLDEDHQKAYLIGEAIETCEGLSLDPKKVETNIVIFKVSANLCSAEDFCEKLEAKGVRTFPFSHEHVRVVTHLGVSIEEARRAGEIIVEVAEA